MTRRRLRVLISSGPTRERIDAARFISNYSTGAMGAQLAAQALARGHRVTVVTGPASEPLPAKARAVSVEATRDMDRALRRLSPSADLVIMAAAVADFRPVKPLATKQPRRWGMLLRLKPTRDILATLPRTPGQIVAGFSVESAATQARGRRKLRQKRVDVLLAQRLSRGGAPFGRRRIEAWLLQRDGASKRLRRVSKAQAAAALLDKMETLWYGQQRSTQA